MPTTLATNQSQRGIVQWIVPPNGRQKQTKGINLSNENNPPTRDLSGSYRNLNTSNASDDFTSDQPSTQRQVDPENAAMLDDATCKTICNIIEEYLKELAAHQKSINNVRQRMSQDQGKKRCVEDKYISFNDTLRLRVRDEQTNAIGTIKQLTNYLRELSHMISQTENAERRLVSEDVGDKLLTVRNNIIQALNDFVLSNNDIDVPLIDLDDPTCQGYDFCDDAFRSYCDTRSLSTARQAHEPNKNTSSNKKLNDQSEQRTQILVEISDSNEIGQSQSQLHVVDQSKQSEEMDKRRREIAKLERNTTELRNLFLDFYNLVKLQSEQVDTIESNLAVAAQHIKEGRQHLGKAPKGLTILIPVTGCITGALIGGPIGLFIGGKLGGVTIICASSLLGLLSSLGAQKCIVSHKFKHD